jgi:hypothetical protein
MFLPNGIVGDFRKLLRPFKSKKGASL